MQDTTKFQIFSPGFDSGKLDKFRALKFRLLQKIQELVSAMNYLEITQNLSISYLILDQSLILVFFILFTSFLQEPK